LPLSKYYLSINELNSYFCKVKQLKNILSILLILLIMNPMGMDAFSSCCTENNNSEMACGGEEKDSDHDCLSFCFCSCCHVSFYLENEMTDTDKSPFSNLDIHSSFIYQPPFSPTVLLDIWQPPKI